MVSHVDTVQLKVIIVGAGIAGLAAATALRQAGHKVNVGFRVAFRTTKMTRKWQVFDSSNLLHEVGAAITMSPNGTRVLAKLGFDFDAARGVKMETVAVYSGATLEDAQAYPPGAMNGIEETLGFPYRAFHRVDLHNELRKMALLDDDSGPEIELHLGVRIVRVDVVNAEIELEDGIVWRGDLLIGADGLHSVVRSAALGTDMCHDEYTEDVGWDIYRWLLDTKDVAADPDLKALMVKDRSTFTLPHEGKTLRIIWYSCRK